MLLVQLPQPESALGVSCLYGAITFERLHALSYRQPRWSWGSARTLATAATVRAAGPVRVRRQSQSVRQGPSVSGVDVDRRAERHVQQRRRVLAVDLLSAAAARPHDRRAGPTPATVSCPARPGTPTPSIRPRSLDLSAAVSAIHATQNRPLRAGLLSSVGQLDTIPIRQVRRFMGLVSLFVTLCNSWRGDAGKSLRRQVAAPCSRIPRVGLAAPARTTHWPYACLGTLTGTNGHPA